MIASDRFDVVTVKERGGRWAVCDANGATLYEYTTETAGRHKAEQVQGWGHKQGSCRERSSTKDFSSVVSVLGNDLCGVSNHMHDERIQLMSLIVQTYRHLTDNLESELEQGVGISLAFFDVLIHVAAGPGARLTMSRLSQQLALTTGGVTRLVDRMVDAGLVLRQSSSSDRRSIQVVLTDAGQEVLTLAIAAQAKTIDGNLIVPLNDSDRSSLAVTLRKVLGHAPSSDNVLYVR